MAVVELNVVAKREPPAPPKGGIKLEIGKSYRDREGVIRGPMRKWDLADTHKGHPVLCCSKFGHVYYSDTGHFVGKENYPDYPAHLVSEAWTYEKEEKAWKEGKDIEYTCPHGIHTPKGEWRGFPAYVNVKNAFGGIADIYMRGTWKQLQYRIKE